MAADLKARRFSVPFTGGSINATYGLLDALFPGTLNQIVLEPITKAVSVNAHTRTKWPGGPSITVDAHNYDKKRYPSGSGSGIATGEMIRIQVNGEWWSARLEGPHYRFCDFLKQKDFILANGILWKGERSTRTYGPFGGALEVN